ncbi:TrmH family RNA methyltransferase [Phosphitispora fastidiosa]|uniref:TrmH family RNA methyltransferase n=1 Tax=Phosphitispora fastidiosa TaxID=2837202 RepID=UPI001E517630|nr:TrmH family RNA methyltransferase [Phosphitispora fastidiosa]
MNRVEVITSRQNSLVKLVRGLGSRRAREAEGVFVIEGPKVIKEALVSGVSPEKIIVSQRALEHRAAAELVNGADLHAEVIMVSDEVMEYMSETETPPGLLGLVRMPEAGLAGLSALKTGPRALLVIIDGVQDPGNVGTVIRAADAFGADAVVTTGGCADIYNGKVLRAAMGSVFHLPVVRDAEPAELQEFLKDRGITVAATSPGENAISLSEARLAWPLAVVFGSEARGVSPEFREAAGILVRIPMPGRAESLNVAVAAGITLYEACRQRGCT